MESKISRLVPATLRKWQGKIPAFLKKQRKRLNRLLLASIMKQDIRKQERANVGDVQKRTTFSQRPQEESTHECKHRLTWNPWLNTICPIGLERACPLDNYLKMPEAESPSPLGVLEVKLPLEIVDMILYRCDIRSLTRLRAVNRRGRQLVSEHPQYKVLMQRMPRLIRAVLVLGRGPGGVSEMITLEELYSLATERYCYQCLGFPVYIHVLARKRICENCLKRKIPPFRQPDISQNTWDGWTVQEAKHHLSILEKDLKKLPKARVLKDPGMLNYWMEEHGGRIHGLSYDDEREHPMRVRRVMDRHSEALTLVTIQDVQKASEHFAYLWYNHMTPWQKAAAVCKMLRIHVTTTEDDLLLQRGGSKRRRNELAVKVPWLDPKTHGVYWKRPKYMGK